MKEFIKKNLLLIVGIIFVLVFFYKFFLYGLLPIPTDNIVGVYHPYRDFYSTEYPRGIPFQNFLVTDPIRQQYLWKELAVYSLKQGELPLWNPYNFSGYPLLANFQSAVFYPLNILLLVAPFEYGWSMLIISQMLLSFIFTFLYIKNLRLSSGAAFVGGLAFSFSGFAISWLEWGNILSTALWLPLILLSIDKIFSNKKYQKLYVRNLWGWIFLMSLVCSFFAGHLQTFFYLAVTAFAYIMVRWWKSSRSSKPLLLFSVMLFAFIVITAIQWVPTLQLISLSGREIDQISSQIEGWFIPWQNLAQFIAPDFFGNPATLNYWGVWNYGEFIGYVGILPLILALGAVLLIRREIVIFYKILLFLSFLFAFPTVISKIPFVLEIPFLASAQPTRLLFLMTFSLSILSAFGFDYFQNHRKRILLPLFLVGLFLAALWIIVLKNDILPSYFEIDTANLVVSKSNLRLPTAVFSATVLLFLFFIFLPKNLLKKRVFFGVLSLIIFIFLLDIFRFADKYTVFSEREYLYPETKTLSYLEDQEGNFRIMGTDSRVLPPNFTINYRLQSVDGYDPLYLLRYAELTAAIGRSNPDIKPPFGFNRIITPQNYHDEIINILNIEYILSLTDIEITEYEKVFQEQETRVYKNNRAIDRAFFAGETIVAHDRQDAIEKIFENKDNLDLVAIVEGENVQKFNREWSTGITKVISYEPNRVEIEVQNDKDGFLVLSDSFYPTWRVSIDGKPTEIIRTNYNFRGIVVPKNSSQVIFTNHLF